MEERESLSCEQEKTILFTRTSFVLSIRSYVQSSILIIGFTLLQPQFNSWSNNLYKTRSDKNAEMDLEFFPNMMQLHDMISERSRSFVEFPDVKSLNSSSTFRHPCFEDKRLAPRRNTLPHQCPAFEKHVQLSPPL